jgi:tetratricopeptide (TPR) repeat protein
MPSLELQMIVRNGAAGLARCLESVQGIADRITIGDTGSTDGTLAIAERFGAKVIPVPWRRDFAAARNAVLAHASCEWILFLDADEMLDPDAVRQIPELLADPEMAAYDVTAWNYVMDMGFRSSGEQARPNPSLLAETRGFPAYFPSTNTRLFRRLAGVCFEHCVHETVADRLAALRLRRRPAEFVIHHFGYVEDAAARRAGKETLYYELALKKAASSPGSCQANLGAGIAELDHAKNPAAALPYLRKAIAIESRSASVWLYAGICYARMGRSAEALAHLKQALAMDAANALAWSSLGDLLLQVGDHAKARNAYGQAIALGDGSALTLAKLGAAEVHLGDRDAGIAKVELAMAQTPDAVELYDIYAPVAFLAGKPKEACGAAERRLSLEKVTAFHFFLAATLHLHAGMRDRAEAIAGAGGARFPEDAEIAKLLDSLGMTSVSGRP